MVLSMFDIIEAAIGKAEKERSKKDKDAMAAKRKPGGGRKVAGRR